MKKSIAFFLALCLAAGFCACGEPAPTEPTEPDYTASEADISQLEKLYEGRTAFQGEFHDHGDTGGTSDGKMKLDDWKMNLLSKDMDFAAIYSKQYRKELLSVELKKSARRVMPYNGKIEGFNVAKLYDFRSSASVEHAYVLVFEENECEKAVVFDATKKLVENMFRQVPSLVVRSNGLPE